MNTRLKRLFLDWSGLWLAAMSVLFVFAWRGWVVAHQPAHLMAMAEELGSTGEFSRLYNKLYPNHSNTCLVYDRYTESGMGIYFCNLADNKKKMVCEQPEKNWSWADFGMMGWSPDDTLFACVFPPNKPGQPLEEIIIYNGATGEEVIRLGAGNNSVRNFAWLSNRSFAYVYELSGGNNHVVATIEQKPDGNWIQSPVFQNIGDKSITGLVATSSHSIAWQQEASLWALDFTDGNPRNIWESSTNQLQSFTYSDKTGCFYLNCTYETNSLQICFSPPTQWHPQGAILDKPVADDKLNNAILQREGGLNALYVKTDGSSKWVHFPWQGQIQNYQVNGDCLYITGELTNQPPGIWKCDFQSGASDQIVSILDHPLKYAQLVNAVSGTFTNSVGRSALYQIWEPTHLETGKKYPLIIGQSPYEGWRPYPQIAANGGCFFVFARRPSWFEGLDNWSEDVMAVYDLMAKNPKVDLGKVYLFGVSAETYPLSQLLAEKADLWRGAILFTPGSTPDLSDVRTTKLLILAGEDEDADTVKRLIDYQDQAAKNGIVLNFTLVKGAQHIFKSSASEREETLQIARFLFGI